MLLCIAATATYRFGHWPATPAANAILILETYNKDPKTVNQIEEEIQA